MTAMDDRRFGDPRASEQMPPRAPEAHTTIDSLRRTPLGQGSTLPEGRTAAAQMPPGTAAALDPRTIEAEIARIRERESNPYLTGIRTTLFNLVIVRADGNSALGRGSTPALGRGLPAREARLPSEGSTPRAPEAHTTIHSARRTPEGQGSTLPEGRTPALGRGSTPAKGIAADPVSPVLDSLLGKRPARIITIEDGGKERTSVFLSGRCFPDARNRGVCFEEIRIMSGADGLGMDTGTWFPLVIRDLPVFLWWLGPLSPLPPLILAASQIVDKLIVDTSYCSLPGEDPLPIFKELSLVPQKTRGAMKVSDLAWKRTRVLRECAARLFNPEAARARLSSISRIFLSGCSRAEALLYFAWLASRLEWKAALETRGAAFTDAAGNRIEAVHEGEAPLFAGFKTAISFSDGGGDLEVSCAGNGCVESGDMKSACRFAEEGEALTEEVDGLEQDAALMDACAAAAALADADS